MITELDVLLGNVSVDTTAEVLKIISTAFKKKYFIYYYSVGLIDHVISFHAGFIYRKEHILPKDFRVPLQKWQSHSAWSQQYI